MEKIKKEIQKLSTILLELYDSDKLSEEDFNRLFEIRCEVLTLLQSSLQLKSKSIMSFKKWFEFNRYEKKNETECFDNEGILFFTHEVSKEYDTYLKINLIKIEL